MQSSGFFFFFSHRVFNVLYNKLQLHWLLTVSDTPAYLEALSSLDNVNFLNLPIFKPSNFFFKPSKSNRNSSECYIHRCVTHTMLPIQPCYVSLHAQLLSHFQHIRGGKKLQLTCQHCGIIASKLCNLKLF